MKQESGAVQALHFLGEAGCLAALGVLLLCFPKAVSAGAADGLRLCFSSLIGSLLPFLVLSRLAFLRGLLQSRKGKARLTRLLFGLPGVCAGVVVFSLLGGYPVGPMLVTMLKENNAVSARQARRMLLFCFGPGPAFVLSAVGVGMLGSKQAGVILYASVVLGALLCGVLTRFFAKKEPPPLRPDAPLQPPLPLAEALFRAVSESVESMVFICGCVSLFSALLSLLSALKLPHPLFCGAAALLEVTNACGALAKSVPLPTLAAVIAFGGVCTHCQIAPFLASGGLSPAGFLGGRALHAAVSWLCCRGLLAVFPLSVGALAQSPQFRPAAQSNAVLSCCMLCMCVLLLVGSGFTLHFKPARLAFSDAVCYNGKEDQPEKRHGP